MCAGSSFRVPGTSASDPFDGETASYGAIAAPRIPRFLQEAL